MRMARKQSEADIYHIVARGTGHQIIFEDNADHEEFLRLLRDEVSDGDFELYAWCLMSNHVHLLVHASLETMARRMRHLLGVYALYFNKRNSRVGHLFQGRFLSEPIDDDAYFLTAIRYIHQNPVKAGIATVDGYRWSSYREYLQGDGICETSFPMSVFESVGQFELLHKQLVGATDCLDVSERRPIRTLSDEEALSCAQEVLEGIRLDALKTLPVKERDVYILQLKQAGFSIRQIGRLTGIGRGPIQRAGVSTPPSP